MHIYTVDADKILVNNDLSSSNNAHVNELHTCYACFYTTKVSDSLMLHISKVSVTTYYKPTRAHDRMQTRCMKDCAFCANTTWTKASMHLLVKTLA